MYGTVRILLEWSKQGQKVGGLGGIG